MSYEIDKILLKIEENVFSKSLINIPTIEYDLGNILYFATKFNYTQKEINRQKALTLLDDSLNNFSSYEFQTGILEGFDGMGWVLHYIRKHQIIDKDNLLKDIEVHLLQSLTLNINSNNYDLLYGSIGKLQYLIDSNKRKEPSVMELIDRFLEKLDGSKIQIEERIYWTELNSDKINLGLSHGITSLFVFLIRLHELGYKNPKILVFIQGLSNSFYYFENKIPGMSCFPAGFPVSEKIISHSRLAWCYGDLGIAYAFLYGSKILHNAQMKKMYLKIMNLVLKRNISDSGLVHFNDYSYFDTGFCHGISGIYYILYKLNELEPNSQLQFKLDYWLKELLKNVNTQLSITDDIFYPKDRQDAESSYTVDKESILNGLGGVALVLLTAKYKKGNWSNFFLLFDIETKISTNSKKNEKL